MRTLALNLVALIASSATFLAFFGGITLVAVGAYWIEPWAGLIVGGLALAGSAVLYELRAPMRDTRE